MNRDTALRLDGMVRAGIAHYMKAELGPEEFQEFIQLVGRTMGYAIDISNRLYELFPDIVPDELNPVKAGASDTPPDTG